MSKGGGGGGGKSSSRPEPWSGAEPFIDEILKGAQGLFNQGVGSQYYPGQNFVGPGADTLASQAMTRNRALTPSPLLQAADAQATNTLQGGFLGAGNPYFSAMTDRIAGEVLPTIQSGFGMSGRVGGSGYGEALSRGLGDAIAPLAFQNFENERGRQMQTLGMAPGTEMAGYIPSQQMGLLGQGVENYEARRLAGDMERFNFNNEAPWSLLGRYQQFVGPNSGFGVASQTRQNGNPMGDILNLARTASLFAAL